METPEIKIGIMGGGGVGKTSWRRLFVDDEFSPNYESSQNLPQTITRWKIKNAPVDEVTTRIVEFPGGTIPPDLPQPHANDNFTALIFMYSLNSKQSLNELKRYIHTASFYPALLVGNQADLPMVKVKQADHTAFYQAHHDLDAHETMSVKSRVGWLAPLEFALKQKYPGASFEDMIKV